MTHDEISDNTNNNVWHTSGVRYESNRPGPAKLEGFRSDIVGESPAIRQMFSMLERVAPLTSTVLIQGETGTGGGAGVEIILEEDSSSRRGLCWRWGGRGGARGKKNQKDEG